MNSNPETVSTDFSVSDKLYFEPLTFEDVMNVIDLEQPKGVIVQFGGQTAINLAEPLAKAGVTILGTQVADLDRAEDRDLFEQALKELIFHSHQDKRLPMKKKQLLQLVRLASQFLSAHLMYLVDVPWKSLKTKKTFVLTCELLLRLVQTTQFLSTLISLGKSAKLMPFQMVKCTHSWYHGAYRTCWCPLR